MKQRHIGVGTNHMSTKGKRYVNDVLDSNRLTYGPYSRKFENLFAKLHKSSFAVLSNSGTSALQVAIHALKIVYKWHDGDEILVPALTFVASVNVILQNGLTPHFVDIDPLYFDIDSSKIAEAITPRTRAIMVVHLFGQPADMSHICKIAKKYKLKIIEDSCETMFAKHCDIPVGAWCDIACFSTYSAHLVTTGV